MSVAVKVVVRCKPSREENAWRVNGRTLHLDGLDVSLAFNDIFSDSTSHADFYDAAISSTVSRALHGESVCVLTYGLPNTGKTHTVFGTAGQTRIKAEARGVVTRCAHQLLSELQEGAGTEGKITKITATFCQVFQDGRVADLLDRKKRSLEVVESPTGGQYSVPGLTHEPVTSTQDALRLVEKGYLMRNVTGCVREVERKVTLGTQPSQPLQQYRPHCSHTLFTYHLEHLVGGASNVMVSHVTVVDLAGRGILEDPSTPCSDEGLRCLHQILTTLPGVEPSSATPPFQQAALTKLLQDGLGGNSHTILIAAVSLGRSCVDDTRRCLEVADGVHRIRTTPKPTSVPLAKSALGARLDEVQSLKSAIAQSLEVSTRIDSWEVVGEGVVRVNGRTYDQLSPSALTVLRKLTSVEEGLLYDGRPEKNPSQREAQPTSEGSVPPVISKPPFEVSSKKPPTKPTFKLPVTIPAKSPEVSGAEKTEGGEERQTGGSTGHGGGGGGGRTEVEEEKSSSSLDEESASESDSESTASIVVSGPPPPPLRGIPHVKPDSPSVEAAIPQPHPLQVKPAPPTRLASIVGSRGSEQTQLAFLAVPRQPLRPIATPPKFSALSRPLTTMNSTPLSSDGHLPAQATATLQPTFSSPTTQPTLSSPTTQPTLLSSTPQHTHPPPTLQPPHPSLTPHHTHPPAKRILFPDDSTASGGEINQFDDTPTVIFPPTVTHSLGSPLHTTAPSHLPPLGLPKLPPTLPPRAQLSPIRPVGMAPAFLSHPLLPPMRARSPSTSSSEETSSSESDTSSEDYNSDEARDEFDTDMRQRRRLPMQSVRPFGSHPSQGFARPPVLPPISSKASDKPQPPVYQQAASQDKSQSSPGGADSNLPDYYQLSGSVPGEGGRQEGGKEERDEDYTSSEEIHVAAMEGIKTSTMKKLVMQFGVDYRDRGSRTPLMYAVLGNQPRMCETLLSMGAQVNAKDSTRLTPLLWATYQARAQVIRSLLRHGADITIRDHAGRSVFHWAVKTPNIQCLKTLCKHPNTGIVNTQDNEGLSPLHWAVMTDQASHVRMLLSSTSADVSTQDREGRTPLNYAVLNFSPSCIKAILDCCESAVNAADPKGRTALHYACAEGSANCVRTLLSYRTCDLHCCDTKGTTPLHWASAANQPGLVQLLLRRGADRGQRDDSEMTPLDHAQQRGHNECVRILQTYGLRRPLSAISVASQLSIPGTLTPSLDEFGHVALRRPKRAFSLSGSSVSSFDRLPADGQAHSECSHDEHPSPETQAVDTSVEGTAHIRTAGQSPSATHSQGAESPLSHDHQVRRGASRSRRVWSLITCGIYSGHSNAIVPVDTV